MATVACEGLALLTKFGALSTFEELKAILVTKIAVPLMESKSSRQRINGAKILTNILPSSYDLGAFTRKNVKSKAEDMLSSCVAEEQNAACSLLATLIIFTSSGTLQTLEKSVESWVKMVLRHENFRLMATIILNCMMLSGRSLELMDLLVRGCSFSFSFISDLKRRQWRISPEQLSFILKDLPKFLTKEAVKEIDSRLVTIKEHDLVLVIARWHLGLIRQGRIRLTAYELLELPEQYKDYPELALTVGNVIQYLVAGDRATQFRLLTQFFAQIKGDCALLSSGESSNVSLASIKAYSHSLALLLSAKYDESFPSNLYSSAELLEQMKTLTLELLDSSFGEDLKTCFWLLLGTLQLTLDEATQMISVINERVPKEPITQAELIDAGPLFFIRELLSHSSIAIEAKKELAKNVTAFTKMQWKLLGMLKTFESFKDPQLLVLLTEVTLIILNLKSDSNLAEIAASISSKLICQLPNICLTHHELLESCQKLLVIQITHCPMTSLQYYLSQFLVFVKSSEVRHTILDTISVLLDHLKYADLNTTDQAVILGILQEILFPFICDTNVVCQRLGAISLGKLVRLVNEQSFRDAILQELIDRSLNEGDEMNRRGYILAISEVYSSYPEGSSHLDMKLVIGLLSSLAKDQRSLIVQAAALEALHRVLDSQSNSMTFVLTADITYLLWQIYLNEPNASCISTAVEKDLLGPIAKTMLVLLEMLGPDIREPSTVSLINRLLVGEFIDYHQKYDNNDGDDNHEIMGIFLDSVMQILLVIQQTDDFSKLLFLFQNILTKGSGVTLSKALSCLRWFLEFCQSAILDYDLELLINSILAIAPHETSDFYFCFEFLFKTTFPKDPGLWTTLLFKADCLHTNIQSAVASPLSGDQRRVSLLDDNERVDSAVILPSQKKACINDEALSLIVKHIMEYLKASHKGHDVCFWSPSSINSFVDSMIRLTMSLIMVCKVELGQQKLKLLGIDLVHSVITNYINITDPLESSLLLLDSFQSQLMTIYSTASQDQDPLIATHTFVSLFTLIASYPKSHISNHPKVYAIIKSCFSLLMNEEHYSMNFDTTFLEDYCRTALVASLRAIEEFLDSDQQIALKSLNLVQLGACTDAFLKENQLKQCTIDLIPSLLYPEFEEYELVGGCLLMLHAKINCEYINAISRMIKIDFIPRKLKKSIIMRILFGELEIGAASKLTKFLPDWHHYVDESTCIQLKKHSMASFASSESISFAQLCQLLSLGKEEFWPVIVLAFSKGCPSFSSSALVEIFSKNDFTEEQFGDLATIIFSDPNNKSTLSLLSDALCHCSLPSLYYDQTTVLLRHYFGINSEDAMFFWRKFARARKTAAIAINSADLLLKHCSFSEMDVSFLHSGIVRDCLLASLSL